MPTPSGQRRRLDFHTWPAALADIDQLHQTGYQRAGNWDLSQILDHVGEGLRTATRGNKNQGPWIVRKLLGPIILKRILKQRRMKAGIKVPQWWLPGPKHDESAAVDKFRADLSAFEKMITTPFPHPFFGQLSKAQWNDLILIHAAHHLSFLTPTT
ncbi:MAG: DUF1569 domain-containing protein [Pirellulales bacterium]|nr:DUF1569 domain-containing protein [Pirellulales bacterium]